VDEAEEDRAVAHLALPDEAATDRLGRSLAAAARAGDVIALRGELGAGKTRLARGFIAALCGEEEVPSPTFTLVQTYDTPRGTIWHFDLYRVTAPEEAVELGIEEAFADGISLIEWPDRLGALLPSERLDVTLTFAGGTGARDAALSARGAAWRNRLGRILADAA
jgi:tRNA threonylcarbamoyladenosine biosynthesis protein TsaE